MPHTQTINRLKPAVQISALLLMASLLSACGITGNLRGNPGYANFDSPGLMITDRTTAISVGPLPIRLARAFVDDDPETRAILRDLKAVRVYVYDVEQYPDRIRQRLNNNVADLNRDGWQSVVSINDDDEMTEILIREKNEKIRGMVVMSSDGDEIVMVNLIGDLKPAMFNSYIDEVDVDVDVEIDENDLSDI